MRPRIRACLMPGRCRRSCRSPKPSPFATPLRPSASGGVEKAVADRGDVLNRRVEGSELDGVEVEMLVVEADDHLLMHDPLDAIEAHRRTAGLLVQRDRSRHLEVVVVAMPVGVVALAEELAVPFVGVFGTVEPMRSGRTRTAAERELGSCGRTPSRCGERA